MNFPVILVLDRIAGPANIGSIFRLADAFNIEKIIFSGEKINFSSARLQKSARSTIKKVIFEEEKDCLEVCKTLKKNSFTLVGLEITEESSGIENLKVEKDQKIALIAGNENAGIDEEILKFVDQSVHINMFGNNSSMNVSQAVGIALYEITRKYKISRNNN